LGITVSTRSRTVDSEDRPSTERRVSENRNIVRSANDKTRTDDGASEANRSRSQIWAPRATSRVWDVERAFSDARVRLTTTD
ncbi:hypothetical protein BE221DRAFT_79488, partial [Ostreococcus tauri]